MSKANLDQYGTRFLKKLIILKNLIKIDFRGAKVSFLRPFGCLSQVGGGSSIVFLRSNYISFPHAISEGCFSSQKFAECRSGGASPLRALRGSARRRCLRGHFSGIFCRASAEKVFLLPFIRPSVRSSFRPFVRRSVDTSVRLSFRGPWYVKGVSKQVSIVHLPSHAKGKNFFLLKSSG